MENKTFSPCPYCDGRDDSCADCELQAYRAKIPFDRLDEAAALVKARDEGRVVLPPEDYTFTIRGDLALGIIKANCRAAARAEAEAALSGQKGGTHEADPV